MRGLVRFGVHNPVPINLLMMGFIIAGVVSGLQLRREFFPEVESRTVQIAMPYPGAKPEQIEETLAIKIENKVRDLEEHVDKVTTTIGEGGGAISVALKESADPDEALEDIEREIDALRDLPDDAEEITAILIEEELAVIRLAVYGDADEATRKLAARAIKDDLDELEGMGEVRVEGVRDYEVRVDVNQEAVLAQGLSLPQVADAVRGWLADIPGGTVRGEAGNISVRTVGVSEQAEAIRELVVSQTPDGGTVRLGEIATITDSFVDDPIINRFNGQDAALLSVFKVGDQDIVKIAEMVRAYVRGRQDRRAIAEGRDPQGPGLSVVEKAVTAAVGSPKLEAYKLGLESPRQLPPGLVLERHSDLARFVEGRLDLLTRNALYGALLVFATLLLVLNWRVAVWVGVGLVTAMSGTLLLMALFDITLNLLTMFGLIVVLGLLVDDAIVVSENIQTKHDAGEPALTAAVSGTMQVFWPVVATVMTSIVAFLPLTFVRGGIGDLLGALPMVVAAALAMSLIESLLILPGHMGHSLKRRDHSHPGRFVSFIRRGELARDRFIHDKLIPWFGGLLAVSLRWRYVSIAAALAALIVTAGLVRGERVGFTFLPNNDSETIVVDVELPIGKPAEVTRQTVEKIEAVARAQPEVKSVASLIGSRTDLETGQSDGTSTHRAQLFIELLFVEQRDKPSSEVIATMRDQLRGKLEQVERISFLEITGGPGGRDITFDLLGTDPDRLQAGADRLKRLLERQRGVFDVADDNELELRVVPRPDAVGVGFRQANAAEQVRGFLFGIDAHVFAEQREDIDVRVRVDEDTRRSLFNVQQSWLINPQGMMVPLIELADFEEASTYVQIKRLDGKRRIRVEADTSPTVSPEKVVANIQPQLEQFREAFPDLTLRLSGRQEQMADAFGSLPLGAGAAILMIYVILAWLFGSYVQPLIVLSVVPFAAVGAVLAHLVLGFELTFLSMIGFVALSGIVVNDSLILVKFYNERRAEGMGVFDGLIAAGRARVRAILMTTVTTVFGLLPLILEQSFQARFLIPMALAIAGGLISATVIVLVVLPCFILAVDDLKGLAYLLWHARRRPAPTAAAAG